MIWIRADAGSEIGAGHVMRCLSIAAALKDMGEQVCFLTADRGAVPLLEAQGQDYRILGGSWRTPEKELDALIPILRQDAKGVFLADSYFVTKEYLRRVGEFLPVCYMDDFGQQGLPVDVLINYNIFAEPSLYTSAFGKTEYLLGTEYAPLRKEFSNARRSVRKRAEKVLITTGGSDRYNLAGRILEQALSHRIAGGMEYYVVSGAYNTHGDYLEKLAQGRGNVRICKNVSDMAGLMGDCDIAVTAGGSTLYELCAVGVPILCFSFVDNQEKIVEGFQRRQAACLAGNYLTEGEDLIRRITEQIGILRDNFSLRQSCSKKEQELVDGKGAERIAERLYRYSQ